MPADGSAHRSNGSELDPVTRHNIRAETYFSAFNGIYMGLAILAAPVVAVTGIQANPLELTILVAAFPIGVFFGPLWAGLGRRIGMQRLVTHMAFWANIPLFLLFWIDSSWQFTLLVSISQIFNSAMRMGQSSLYHVLYPKSIRGRVLGKLTFWTFVTMVPSILLTGWMLDISRELFRVLYPLAGLCGMFGCYYYGTLIVDDRSITVKEKTTIRATMRGVSQILSQDKAYLYFQTAFFLSGAAFFMSTHIVLLLTCDRFEFSAFDLAFWMTVVPQLMLAVSSPIWGRVLDRIGIVHSRLVIAFIQCASLGCYWLGIITGWPLFIYLGSIFLGIANGGGQLTWALASSHFAPRAEDVPLYNGIHFVLNGIRGLVMPWVGSVIWVLSGPFAVLLAFMIACTSVPIILRSLKWDELRDDGAEADPAGFGTPDAEPPLPVWEEPPAPAPTPKSRASMVRSTR